MSGWLSSLLGISDQFLGAAKAGILSFINNKYYVEQNLVKMQMYDALIMTILKDSKKSAVSCTLKNLLKQYHSLIRYDSYCHIKNADGTYVLCKYEYYADENRYYIWIRDEGRDKRHLIRPENMFKGIFKPINEAVFTCTPIGNVNITPSSNTAYEIIQYLVSTTSVWNSIEMIALSTDSVLRTMGFVGSNAVPH